MVEIKEMIEFAGFNSKSNNMYLINRDAPSPEEKEIIENIPFMQGILDFSMILGERVFHNREITYEFILVDNVYQDRARFETMLKRQLMPFGQQKLYDSHDINYYWLGKCKSVEVEHDNKFNNLRITIVFDCYPFMFSLLDYFDDVWDSFDFNDGIAGFTKYSIKDKKEIILINTSMYTTKPRIIASAEMKLYIDNNTYIISKGENPAVSLALEPGVNKLNVEGSGIIQFRWNSEVMG